MHLQRELDVARTIAREAGAVLRELYDAQERDFDEKPHGGGPVTEADKRANALLVAAIREAFPDDGIVAEESKDNSDPTRFRRSWFLDPMDGTREFVAGREEFAVHVGLAIEGEAVLGVVYRPVGDKLYAGVVGEGAELTVRGKTRSLQVSTETDKLRVVVSRSHLSRLNRFIIEKLGIDEVIHSGSVGLKCGLLAEGAADLYLHASPRSSRWDACAPEALLRAAGGVLTDLHGDRYRYDGRELENVRGLLGCNAVAFSAVVAVVRDVLAAHPRPGS